MDSKRPIPTMAYTAPSSTGQRAKHLVAHRGTPQEQRFTFSARIEIGRFHEKRNNRPGVLLLNDPTVSSRHCVIRQEEDGRCYIRDTSRNGTTLDGRRLVPNVEVEISVGQSICVGDQIEFFLSGEPAEARAARPAKDASTLRRVMSMNVTVLVGDIRDYTALVQRADPTAIQRAIRRVLQKLETKVTQLGGTFKEFRGDAIFAYWEEHLFENQAIEACRAALALDAFAQELATDCSAWGIPDVPLTIDWALATGPVTIDSIGDDHPAGLLVLGPAVVLAFRIEKYANDETGPVVACQATRDRAAVAFEFTDLGDKHCEGFDNATRIYALMGPR